MDAVLLPYSLLFFLGAVLCAMGITLLIMKVNKLTKENQELKRSLLKRMFPNIAKAEDE